MSPHASQSPSRRLVHGAPIHEAGHIIAAIAIGGRFGLAWARDGRGGAIASAESPFGSMIVEAGGNGAEAVVSPFWIELGTPAAPPSEHLPIDREELCLGFMEQRRDELQANDFKSDKDRFEDRLRKLTEESRIKKRPYLFGRWWWRAQREAHRIIERHRHETRLIAAALERRGTLLASDISELLKGTPLAAKNELVSRYAGEGAACHERPLSPAAGTMTRPGCGGASPAPAGAPISAALRPFFRGGGGC